MLSLYLISIQFECTTSRIHFLALPKNEQKSKSVHSIKVILY